MSTIVVAADAKWVRDLVKSACTARGSAGHRDDPGPGRDVVGKEKPDLVVLDMQIGNMGGLAIAIDLRLEEGAHRLPYVPVLSLGSRICSAKM